MKKILILSFYYQPDLCAGSFRCSALVEQLAAYQDLDITVVTTAPNRYASYATAAPAYEQRNNLTVHRLSLPTHKSGLIDQIKAFFSFYRQALRTVKGQKFDLVFATSSRLFTAFLGARVANKLNAPLYLDIRDIFLDTISDIFSAKKLLLIKPVIQAVEKYTFSSAKRINLVSAGFAGYFKTRYPDTEYRWFTNGIDDEFVRENDLNAAREPGLIRVLYAGNIGEGQGLHSILPELSAAMAGVAEFTVIGDGGRKSMLQDKLQSRANVTLLPPVNREQLALEYAKADVLFLHLNDYPAFEKVLPSKVFEYAASGKPVWAGVSGFAADFITSEVENAAVFYPGDHLQAKQTFDSLKLNSVSRDSFVAKYLRRNIMKLMAQDIYQFCQSGISKAN